MEAARRAFRPASWVWTRKGASPSRTARGAAARTGARSARARARRRRAGIPGDAGGGPPGRPADTTSIRGEERHVLGAAHGLTPKADHRRAAAGHASFSTSRRRSARATCPCCWSPLAAPPICFDLRRGCSMAEHLLGLGHPTYMVDYGSIAFSDRDLGLEHRVQDVLPGAIATVSEHAGGKPVQVVGWCLGGIMSLLALAARPDLPVNSIAAVASPFDFAQLRMFAPIRGVANITNGFLGTAVYRALGARRRRSSSACSSSRRWTSTSPSRSRSRPTFTTATSWPRSRPSTTSSTTCTPTRGGRWASSTTSSSGSTTSPTASCRSVTTTSTSPTCACRS